MENKPLNGQLDDALVVTVFGPGKGESIVITVDDKWLVVDSCVDQKSVRPKQLLDANYAQWSCVVLTHPHYDHCRGLLDVISGPGTGPIGCAYPFVFEPETWVDSPDLVERFTYGELEDVIAAVHDRWEGDQAEQWDLRRGSEQFLGEARLEVLHPDEDTLAAVEAQTKPHLNRLSAPLLIEWHDLRLLLGADLPAREWDEMEPSEPPLTQHHFLKFPHHGSHANGGSLSETFGGGDNEERHWILTPYNSSKIPGAADGQGLPWALARVSKVHLTGLPRSARLQGDVPLHATLEELADGKNPEPLTESIAGLDAIPVESDGATVGEPRCFVSLAFDRDGTLKERCYGNGAVVVSR